MVSVLDRIRIKRAKLSNNNAELDRFSVKGREVGNTFVLYILLFPVVFAAFGLAIDTTLATYTQTSLQSSLDAALQSSLSRAVNPGAAGTGTATQPLLSKADAHKDIINVYDINRTSSGEQPFVNCSDGAVAGFTSISPPSGCGWLQKSFVFKNASGAISSSMTIREQSSPIFLRFVGIDEFTYDISSDARITYARG